MWFDRINELDRSNTELPRPHRDDTHIYMIFKARQLLRVARLEMCLWDIGAQRTFSPKKKPHHD